MKSISIAIILVLLVPSTADLSENSQSLRVLFVGNSLTYYNDVPELARIFYQSVHGDGSMDVEMLAAGGKSIRSHLEDGYLNSVLESEVFDIVLLQDIGGWPVCDPAFPGCGDAVASMERAVRLVKKHNAIPVWYSTFQSIPRVQKALSDKVQALGVEWDVSVADVGAALTFYRDELQRDDGFLEDGHPDLVGSLIAAATIVKVIDGISLAPDPGGFPVCFRRWQGAGLLATKLASAQGAPERICEEVSSTTVERVIDAAVRGVKPAVDRAGASSEGY
jgi:hypothetical protein